MSLSAMLAAAVAAHEVKTSEKKAGKEIHPFVKTMIQDGIGITYKEIGKIGLLDPVKPGKNSRTAWGVIKSTFGVHGMDIVTVNDDGTQPKESHRTTWKENGQKEDASFSVISAKALLEILEKETGKSEIKAAERKPKAEKKEAKKVLDAELEGFINNLSLSDAKKDLLSKTLTAKTLTVRALA
jgi:hypothetical protein